MSAADILLLVGKLNLAAAAAIVLVLALRPLARPRLGARLTYALWMLPPVAMLASLVPARQRFVELPAAAPQAASFPGPLEAGVIPAMPSGAAAGSLDPFLLGLWVWIAGAAIASLCTLYVQWRFTREARRGSIGPAVVGVFTPRVITPRDFADRFDAEEQRLVLAHEQVHIHRQDLRLNALATAVQCLFWFNPFIHLANRQMRIDQELACDEAVITRFPQGRLAYARALVKSQLANRPLPLGCYWPSGTEHPFLERIAMLKSANVGRGRRPGRRLPRRKLRPRRHPRFASPMRAPRRRRPFHSAKWRRPATRPAA